MEIIFRHLSLSEIGAEQLLKMSKNTTESNTIHRLATSRVLFQNGSSLREKLFPLLVSISMRDTALIEAKYRKVFFIML